MTSSQQKFIEVLKEIFQIDQADLDFGIYRILNQKKAEIEKYLNEDLMPQVASELAKYRGGETEAIKESLTKLEKTIRDTGMNPDESPKVKELRATLAKYGDDQALQDDVFSHLASFFRRYYDNGDFLSLRRYKKDTYAIPYEGEEVKLHWANSDQYYIKTSEYLKDYAFRLPSGKKVHFKLVDATQERDNNKAEAEKERRFKLHEEEPFRIDGDELFIQFDYLPNKEKQKKLNDDTVKVLREREAKLRPFAELFNKVSPEDDRLSLEKHLSRYTARFNFDFFIHKDLGGFLTRELDFYLKNEVLYVDDLDAQDDNKLKSAVAKVKVIKHIAHKIIVFLAQLENFQKKLWLKKKVVVDCGWCVTLDRVPEVLYPEIAKNDAQCEEWIKLFAINQIKTSKSKASHAKPLTVEFLKANPYLVLDTKHFNGKFREKMLASIDNLDEATNGVIINSENFQAIKLLSEYYRGKVKCIYIDPPYNTGDSEIVYKNEYLYSSWLTLMENRIAISVDMLSEDPVLFIAIDDFEMVDLCELMDNHFSLFRREMIIVNHHPQGGKAKILANTHEYMLTCVRKTSDNTLTGRMSEDGIEHRPFKRSGTAESNFRYGRPNSFYAILVNPKTKDVIGIDPPPPLGSKYPTESTEKGLIRIYPLGNQGEERVWRRSYESCMRLISEKNLRCSDNLTIYQLIAAVDRTPALFSNWIDPRYNAGTYGANLLRDIIGEQNPFSYPKSIYTVEDAIFSAGFEGKEICLDYFAGSGTTGHAIINLNREDDGCRKYVLVEMGAYFDEVLKPRIQKVIYSKDWKDGKPVSREGISHIFKYMRLESYDDALDNLDVGRTPDQQMALGNTNKQTQEEYMLSYMLDIETKASDSLLNTDRFSDPFNFTLKIRKDNELNPCKIDLVETFNYLIGLYVERVETIDGFKVVRGKLRTGEKTLVIWRNTKEKTSEALDNFFRSHGFGAQEYDLIYVNGDNNLENMKTNGDRWKVVLLEDEFKKRMFEASDI